MVNCMTAANFWVITRRRDLAVCKAFGWPGARIIGAVVGELAGILLISLGLGLLLTAGAFPSHQRRSVHSHYPLFPGKHPAAPALYPGGLRGSPGCPLWESIRRR